MDLTTIHIIVCLNPSCAIDNLEIMNVLYRS